jgi:hypothetical protein
MDVFAIRQRLITDYAEYVQSFIRIKDPRILQYVDRELRDGLLWPDPLIQLNPNFEPGAWIEELVADGTLHADCSQVFRLKEVDGTSKPLRLHRHQTDAVEAARAGYNYVLTTGTGSGKSLAYIVPIVDFVLRQGSGKGISAIVVYPMNALANSQFNELEKFLCRGSPQGQPPVTFRRYTGQEMDEERDEILASPPDILLTNYVMLELMLTRPREHKIVASAHHALRFLVLDELHTYRGRQGADVSLLVRRVREVAESSHLQCVGTSATLAEEGTLADQQAKIAAIAGRIFGASVQPAHVIGETLRRATRSQALDDPAFLAELTHRVSGPTQQPPSPRARSSPPARAPARAAASAGSCSTPARSAAAPSGSRNSLAATSRPPLYSPRFVREGPVASPYGSAPCSKNLRPSGAASWMSLPLHSPSSPASSCLLSPSRLFYHDIIERMFCQSQQAKNPDLVLHDQRIPYARCIAARHPRRNLLLCPHRGRLVSHQGSAHATPSA